MTRRRVGDRGSSTVLVLAVALLALVLAQTVALLGRAVTARHRATAAADLAALAAADVTTGRTPGNPCAAAARAAAAGWAVLTACRVRGGAVVDVSTRVRLGGVLAGLGATASARAGPAP